MAKLYPPTIESKLPAQAGETLSIPFIINRAVDIENFDKRVRCIIKTLQTNTEIGQQEGTVRFENSENLYYADFLLDKTIKLNIGQFYKIQIALISKDSNYGNSDLVGYYSTLGVFKYTTVPKLSIPELEKKSYYSSMSITGTYSQVDQDVSEKIYSYEFIIQDAFNKVVASSGELVHDSTSDSSISYTEDHWKLDTFLEIDKKYYIIYKIKTINGLVAASRKYQILNTKTIDLDIGCNLIAENNYDDGCISVFLKTHDLLLKKSITGNFIVSRASDKDNFQEWAEVHRIRFNKHQIIPGEIIKLWDDYTVEHGVSYKYSVEGYNSIDFHSNKMISEETVQALFEDMFLMDKDKQLKIKFNPKINSFKSTVLETKIDTIGGKYPFVIRNGNVQYKEFQLSGLISMLMDDNEKFIQGLIGYNNEIRERTLESNDKLIENYFPTNLIEENIYKERIFREKVLEWLTNGEPKLFKSPTEGNFLIRLINVSLTPNDTLGRMLYTFNSTAYEIGDASIKNLINLGFGESQFESETVYKFDQIEFSNELKIFNLFGAGEKIKIFDASPGSKFKFYFSNNTTSIITIGINGTYTIPASISGIIKVENLTPAEGAKLSYCYEVNNTILDFDTIVKMTVYDKIKQYNGFGDYSEEEIAVQNNYNIFKPSNLNKIYFLRITRKNIVDVYKKDD